MGGDEGPAVSGIGIALAGATKVTVDDNTVDDNVPSGLTDASGGIVLVSTIDEGGTPASDNRITDNHLDGNRPFDISDDGAGTGNRFDDNRCETSSPAGLCGHDNGHHDDQTDSGNHDSRV